MGWAEPVAGSWPFFPSGLPGPSEKVKARLAHIRIELPPAGNVMGDCRKESHRGDTPSPHTPLTESHTHTEPRQTRDWLNSQCPLPLWHSTPLPRRWLTTSYGDRGVAPRKPGQKYKYE